MKRKILGLLITLAFIFFTLPSAFAQDNKPLTIEADSISYDSSSGGFNAKGNVVAIQEGLTLKSDNLEGNMNTKDVHAFGNVIWQKEQDSFQSREMFYNYEKQIGSFTEGKGSFQHYYFQANYLEKEEKEAQLTGASLTTCDKEKNKCYEIRAKKITIYPNKKLIAEDASFYILGKKIFTLKKYQKSMKKKNSNSGLPKPGFSDKDGASMEYKYDLNVSDEENSFLALNYYAKKGFYLRYEGNKETEKETWKFVVGKDRDKDKLDLEMLPSLTWQKKPVPIGNSPWNYTLIAGGGYFSQKEKDIRTWKVNAGTGIFHDPIDLGPSTKLYLGVNYDQNWYGNDNEMGVFSYNVGVAEDLSKRGIWAINYIHRHINGHTPFNFDDPGAARELNASIDYQLDGRWRMGVSAVYDLDKAEYTDLDYTITRNLHCFDTKLTWREKRKEINWSVDLAEF